MGGQWDHSKTITYSFAPDGVNWDRGTNNLNASLNAEFGGSSWQSLVAKALQTWSSVTNLNFSQVGDGPYSFNAVGVNQGDPKFGDIRIGGYNFGTTSTIAQTYGPPPNGYTGAGDVELNTGFNFAPGSGYDLETILIHEIGHSLGLGESPQPASVMYSNYQGSRQTLSAYDIEGIQSLYGARQTDVYQSQGLATSATTALDLTPVVNSAGQGALAGLSVPTIGGIEYFSVVAPNATGATLDVAAIAQGFSLLSPKISLIDPSTGATLAVASNPNASGNVALAGVADVQAGHRYLIAVSGATSDAFSVGSYGIQLGFFGGQVGVPPADPYLYNNTFATATNLGTNTQPTLYNLTLPTALNDQIFSFQTTQAGTVQVAALGALVDVGNAVGQVVTIGTGTLSFYTPGPGKFYLILLAPTSAPVMNYAIAVRTPVSTPSLFRSSSSTPALSTVSTTVEVASAETSTADPVAGGVAGSSLRKAIRPPQPAASVLRP